MFSSFSLPFSSTKKCIHLLWTQVDNGDGLETITMSPGMHQMMIQGPPGTEPQVLQVLSLKDATVLTKAMSAIDVKNEDGATLIEN